MADGSEGREGGVSRVPVMPMLCMRAEGRTPGDEGRKAIERNRKTRKFVKEMEEKYGPLWRHGHTEMEGI
ncbi:MAG TPA: hypothetical protein VEI52_08280 [Terriglobales bacterium]|nr:hypothetical protein [Terriglobales bacterium]